MQIGKRKFRSTSHNSIFFFVKVAIDHYYGKPMIKSKHQKEYSIIRKLRHVATQELFAKMTILSH